MFYFFWNEDILKADKESMLDNGSYILPQLPLYVRWHSTTSASVPALDATNR